MTRHLSTSTRHGLDRLVRRLLGPGLAAFLVGVLVACNGAMSGSAAVPPAQTGATEQPGDTNQDSASSTISLRVARAAGGSVLLFAPVTIGGNGPYDFVVDTGASRTVVDRQLAEQLKLSEVPGITAGANTSGPVQASIVRLTQSRVGPVDLPETLAASVDLQDPSAEPLQELVGERLYGLLGSDVLSQFKVVTIDYERGELHLGRS